MPGMYMGPSSAFGGAFGGGAKPVGPNTHDTGGGEGFPTNGRGMVPGSPPTQVTSGPFGKGAMNQPINSTPAPQPAPTMGPNTLGPTAIRASGPSQGYDASYLQNLATAIGGLFSNSKQGGNVMNVNPLGNLSEISPSSSMEGNAPQAGLPQTWLQQALAGLGFSFGPPPSTATSVTPTAPVVGPGRGRMGAGLPFNQ